MMVELTKTVKVNPLDAVMTPAQVVRRRFKSSLPRTVKNTILTKMAAMARAEELYERFRGEMAAEGLEKSDVSAALVYCQPETPGLQDVLAQTAVLPDPDKGNMKMFVETTMSLDKPLFLGVLFFQTDHKATKQEQRHVAFVAPFMSSPEADKRLLAARKQQAQRGAHDYRA